MYLLVPMHTDPYVELYRHSAHPTPPTHTHTPHLHPYLQGATKRKRRMPGRDWTWELAEEEYNMYIPVRASTAGTSYYGVTDRGHKTFNYSPLLLHQTTHRPNSYMTHTLRFSHTCWESDGKALTKNSTADSSKLRFVVKVVHLLGTFWVPTCVCMYVALRSLFDHGILLCLELCQRCLRRVEEKAVEEYIKNTI